MSSPLPKDHRNGVRVLCRAFGALFLLLCLCALLVYLGWHGKPGHWTKEQQRLAELTTQECGEISESFRNQIMTQWSDPGDRTPLTEADLFGQRRTIELPFDSLNTWIQTEGVSLLKGIGVEVPATATRAMIDSPGDGLIRISFEVLYDDTPQVIALSFKVEIADNGTLTSTLHKATAGRLPVPASTAISLVASQTDGGVLLDLMQGTPLPPIDLPIDPGADGLRDGRLVGLEVHSSAIIISRETVRRHQAN